MSGPGRSIPSSDFADDDGEADAGVAAALQAHDRGDGGAADVLTALARSRLLVPVVTLGEEAAGESAHLAAVSTTGRDGRRGMLAFTCVESLRRWDAEARPVPVPTRSAAEAALADGAEAMVIDLAGPVMFAVEAADLRTLASGWRPLGPWPGAEGAEQARAATTHDRPVPRRSRVRAVARRAWRRVRAR